MIITDAEGKQPVVILSLDDYEALLGQSSAEHNEAPKQEMRKQPTKTEAREPLRETEEEYVNMAEIEAAVEAVNREAASEPKIVPITRKNPPADAGEEQFYMEPI